MSGGTRQKVRSCAAEPGDGAGSRLPPSLSRSLHRGLTAPSYPVHAARRGALYLSEGELLSIWLVGGYDYRIKNNLKFTFEAS